MTAIYFKVIKLGKPGLKDSQVVHEGTYHLEAGGKAALVAEFQATWGYLDTIIYSKPAR